MSPKSLPLLDSIKRLILNKECEIMKNIIIINCACKLMQGTPGGKWHLTIFATVYSILKKINVNPTLLRNFNWILVPLFLGFPSVLHFLCDSNTLTMYNTIKCKGL